MIYEGDLIENLKKLPNDFFSIKEGEKCKYFSQCPLSTVDCIGSKGRFDNFICDTKKLKEVFLNGAKRSINIKKSKGIGGNTITS